MRLRIGQDLPVGRLLREHVAIALVNEPHAVHRARGIELFQMLAERVRLFVIRHIGENELLIGERALAKICARLAAARNDVRRFVLGGERPVHEAEKLGVEAAAKPAVAAEQNKTVLRRDPVRFAADPEPAEQREHVGAAAGIGGELLADLAHARVLDRGGGAHRLGELTGGADAFQPLSELLQSCHQSASANAVSAAWSAALVSSSSFLPVLSVSVRAGSFVMNHEKSWDEKSLRSSASTLSA